MRLIPFFPEFQDFDIELDHPSDASRNAELETRNSFSISAAADDDDRSRDAGVTNFFSNQNKKRRGQTVEYRLALECMERNIACARPYLDCEKYDAVVLPHLQLEIRNPKFETRAHWNGRELRIKVARVQVRSAFAIHHGAYDIPLTSGAAGDPYHLGDFEILAAYVDPERAWYIIPVEALVRRSPKGKRPKAKAPPKPRTNASPPTTPPTTDDRRPTTPCRPPSPSTRTKRAAKAASKNSASVGTC